MPTVDGETRVDRAGLGDDRRHVGERNILDEVIDADWPLLERKDLTPGRNSGVGTIKAFKDDVLEKNPIKDPHGILEKSPLLPDQKYRLAQDLDFTVRKQVWWNNTTLNYKSLPT
jgi:hypothetical protein